MKLTITRRTDLALRALRLLEADGGIMRASEMAPALLSTPHYLPQVLRPLVRAGWLASEPGPTGGYGLAGPLADRSILALIEAIEGPTDNGVCVLSGGPCAGQVECSLHAPWLAARAALLERLADIPISDLNKKGAES